MNVVVDVDGTITAAPAAFAALMKALMEGGHGVYVLTGAIDPNSPGAKTEMRMEQLAIVGLNKGTHYTDVHVFVDRDVNKIAYLKADFCRDHDVAMFFDDSKLFLEATMIRSPKTLRLTPHVVRAD
jgi:hypothetical protein